MPDNKMIHDFDQASAQVRDTLVPFLKSFYDACLENGFSAEETLSLTIEYMKISLNSLR